MRLPLLSLAVLAAALVSPLSLQAPKAALSIAAEEARVIVKFKADASLLRPRALAAAGSAETAAQHSGERAALMGQRLGLAMRGGGHISERAQVVFASGISSAQLAQRLMADADVEYAVPDQRRRRFTAPNDSLYADGQPATPGPAVGQWYLRAPAGAIKSSIDIEAAWAVTLGSPSVVVAVLDTGIRFDHADFKRVAAGGNLLDGYDFIANDFIANDATPGRDADASDTGDFVTAADVASPGNTVGCDSNDIGDSSWHGTQTASLVGAATNNGLGMAGIGRNARVLPLRVLGKCGGFDSDIQAAMRWAVGLSVPGVPDNPVANRARVLNLSLGSAGSCSQAYVDVVSQVNAAGAVVVASAGNGTGHAVSTPANCPGVIAVAGLRHVGTKVGFSDLGPEVALAAPGGNCINIGVGQACLYPIITALNSGAQAPIAGAAGSIYSDSFNVSVGTSFSAPMVAGTAALLLSAQPALTPAQVRNVLQATARAFPTTGGENNNNTPVLQCTAPQFDNTGKAIDQDQCYCTTTTCGAGMLDAGAAVRLAAAGLQARIAVATASPAAALPVQLDASSSFVVAGRSIVSYLWVITDGGGIVSAFTGRADQASVSVTPSAAGRFGVSVTVIDSSGATSTAGTSVDVQAAAVVPPPAPSGGGGGGALGLGWLLALLLAVGAVKAVKHPAD